MNNELFDRANERYRLRDYRGALMAFTECLQDTQYPLAPGEMGLLYHQIGNCLVKLKNPTEAIQAYSQATADTAYGALGTVECNLGMAYASLRDYENAIRYFEQSVQDQANPTPYKSYMGMGNALMKLGKSAEAGVAFREAALDESNPDPTKALLNLGVCFMALNRPADAVASYESAMQFDMLSSTRNKLQASLGQAYVACGQMEKAVHAFEEAIADKTYFLSDSDSVDYQRAVGAVAQGTSESSQATQVLQLADMSGLDVAADGTSVYDEAVAYEGEAAEPFYYDEPYEADPTNFPGYVGAYENVQVAVHRSVRREGNGVLQRPRRGQDQCHARPGGGRRQRYHRRREQIHERLHRVRHGGHRGRRQRAVQNLDGARRHRLEGLQHRAVFPQPKLVQAFPAWGGCSGPFAVQYPYL